MANLLDQASIVLTPTAYDDGKVLCAKPSEPPYGDFDFSRNSAATRVNAQGLVENVQILSSNLVQNGDFSEEGVQEVSNGSFSQEGSQLITNGDFATDNDWVKGTGWSISGGAANFDSVGQVSNSLLQQSLGINISGISNIDFTEGENTYYWNNGSLSFKLTFTFTRTSGTNRIRVISSGTILYFSALNGDNLVGSIDNVSVREVGQDWTLGTNWSIAEDKITSNASGLLQQSTSELTVGKTYKTSFEITEYTSGGVKLYSGSGSDTPSYQTSLGTHVVYFVANGNTTSLYSNNFIGSITNISVKEVGQNWTLGTGWEIGNSVATKSGTDLSYLTQSSLTSVVGKTYNVKASITNVTTGNVRIDNFTSGTTYTSDTEVDVIYTATTAGAFRFLGWSGFDGTITNISVLEITDDTNLPRINYENFSYQDALGSELVVNGDFDTDSDWVKGTGWTISGGTANAAIPVASGLTASVGALTIGTTYKLTYTISNYSAGNIVIQAGWQASGASRSANGTYTEYLVCAGDTYVAFLGTSSFIGSIDNVSVKEYSGQEVVPDSGCGSWLWEPQSTNLYTQSELFTDSSWNKTQTVIEAASITLPNGLTNGFKLFANTTGGTNHWLEKSPFPTATTGQDYTLSLFVKSAGSDFIQIASSSGFPSKYQNFNISTGTKASGDISDSSITDFGNGWYRISVTETTISTTARYLIVPILSDVGRNAQFAGNADQDGVYIWGAMLEQNSFSTSYIPTEGSQVTRNQDLCTNGGSLATINSTEGVFYAEIKRDTPANTFHLISLNNASSNSDRNSVTIGVNSGDNFYVRVKSPSGTFTSQIIPMSIGDFHKIAIRYEQANIGLFIDGTKETTYLGNYLFDEPLDNLSFDYNGDGSLKFFGKTKALAVWKEALSDQELADLTYPTPTDPTFSLDFNTIAEQFTFARGSEATYVDAQGLIQSTNEIGSELITNGDFDTDSDWTKSGGVSISSGKAVFNAPSLAILYQNLSGTTQGTTYKVTYTISEYISGSIFFGFGNGIVHPQGTIRNANGTYTEYITKTDALDSAGFRTNAFIGSIDNVSVKEYITATNTPRLDYSTGAEAFLLEPQSTNLIPYSEDFSNAYWGKTSISVLSNVITSPSGEINASKIVENNTNSNFQLYNRANVTSGSVYTSSIFAKSSERYLQLKSSTGFASSYANFDLINGVLGTNGGSLTPSIEDFGNGWYRCSVTYTATSTTNALFVWHIVNSASASRGQSYQGDGTSGVYIWGAQIEAQSYATSYIPSNGSTVTRNQETCINATPEINSEEGVLYAEISALANDGTYRSVSLSDGTNTNRVNLTYSTASNLLLGFINVNGVNTSFTFTVNPITDFVKCALKYKNNDCSLWVNGVEISNSTSQIAFPINTLTKLSFTSGSSSSNFFGNTKDLQVYTKALSDAELIKLTT